MKVTLKIKSQKSGVYRVQVFKYIDGAMVYDTDMTGLIWEIKRKLEDRHCDEIEIEKSIFQGWY
jgi:hypothetical protein